MAPTVSASRGANESGNNEGTLQVAQSVQNAPKFSGAQPEERKASTEVPKTQEEIKALDFARKFSQLSKKEAQLRAKETELASKYKPMEEELSTYKELKTLKENAKNNPLAVLRALGLSYDDVVNFQLQGGESAPELHYKELERKFENSRKEIEEKIESEKKKEQEERTRAAIDTYKRNIHSFVNENSNEYELINFKGAFDTVFQTIEEHWNKHGVELSLKEACDAVEKYFESEELDKLASLNKVKSKFVNVHKEEPKASLSPLVRTPSVTLSSKIGAELKGDASSELTQAERLRRAAEILRAGRKS